MDRLHKTSYFHCFAVLLLDKESKMCQRVLKIKLDKCS